MEKYLVYWKGFTVEYDTWKRRKNLGNAKEVLEEFEGRMDAEVRRQEKIDRVEEWDFRKGELLGKFMARMLYGCNDGKFKKEYLKKLKKNWRMWKNDWKEVEKEELEWEREKQVEKIIWRENTYSHLG